MKGPIRQTHMPTPVTRRPWVLSLFVSSIYVTCSAIYIIFSGQIVAAYAHDLQEFHRLEVFKGIGFCLATGVLGFLASFFLLQRLHQQQTRLLSQQAKILAAEQKAMASLFASAIAHDINNLLTIAHSSLSFLLMSSPSQPFPHDQLDVNDPAQELSRSLDELAQLSRRLMALGVDADPTLRTLELEEVVRESLDLVSRHRAVKACTLQTVLGGPNRVFASASSVQRILLNLVLNAAEATGPRGIIEIRTMSENANAVLEVHDNGPGIPSEERERIFEPCYTSKEHGTGLGLASVMACVQANRGSVVVGDSDLGGACFRVSFSKTN